MIGGLICMVKDHDWGPWAENEPDDGVDSFRICLRCYKTDWRLESDDSE